MKSVYKLVSLATVALLMYSASAEEATQTKSEQDKSLDGTGDWASKQLEFQKMQSEINKKWNKFREE